MKILHFPGGGSDSPEHAGIVYSYGSRDISQRHTPPYGNALHKKYSVYGTDYSGLQIILLQHAGIDMPVKSATPTFADDLQKALKLTDIKLSNLGYLSANDIKRGDIIWWPVKRHIGLVAEQTNHSKIVYQSNGTGEPTDDDDQQNNISLRRGVHPLSLSGMVSGFWGPNYVILRLEDKNTYEVKCKVNGSDWKSTEINISLGPHIYQAYKEGSGNNEYLYFDFDQKSGQGNGYFHGAGVYDNIVTDYAKGQSIIYWSDDNQFNITELGLTYIKGTFKGNNTAKGLTITDGTFFMPLH